MYKDIFTTVYEDVEKQWEGEFVKCIRKAGIEVDKEELIKAPAYDRHQYEQGIEDGKESGYAEGYQEGYKNGSNYYECGCEGCAFEDVEEWEMPCVKCKRGCKDYYRREVK